MIVSEGGHWYQADGTPEYHQEIKSGKNKGNLRATTLRDARTKNLYPSVTTILNIMDKPALTNWKVEKSLEAAYEVDCGGLTYPEWRNALREFDAQRQAQDAADKGTEIHCILEQYFETGEVSKEDYMLTEAVEDELIVLGKNDWLAEKSCASEAGFAGKVDLHSDRWVIDFKTKDGDLSNVKCYDDHFRQLAAYSYALPIHKDAQCANLFISRDTVDDDGVPIVKLIKHTHEQTQRGLNEFLSILQTWQQIKEYKPDES